MRRIVVAISGLLLPLSLAGAAVPDASSVELAARFGVLESVEQISISPNGKRLVYVGAIQQSRMIFIADLVNGGLPVPIFKVDPADGRRYWCRWASDERLVCEIGSIVNDAGTLLGFSRLFAVNADGSKLVRLTAPTNSRTMGLMQYGGDVIDWDVPGSAGSVLMGRAFIPENSMGTTIKREDEGYGIELVDTLTLRRSKVESPRRDAVSYIGQSRFMNERLRSAGKRSTLVEFPGFDHQLDSSQARSTLLSQSDAFLREAFGM